MATAWILVAAANRVRAEFMKYGNEQTVQRGCGHAIDPNLP
jgi:hypothetical protein